MKISLRLSNEDFALMKEYAAIHKISVSEFLRESALEKIEDEYDLKIYKDAMQEFKKDSATYSLDETEKELRLK